MNQTARFFAMLAMGAAALFWGFLAIGMIKNGVAPLAILPGGLCLAVIIVLLCIWRGKIT